MNGPQIEFHTTSQRYFAKIRSSRETIRFRVIATIKAESRFGPDGMNLLRLSGLSIGTLPAWFRRIVNRDFDGRFLADWFDHFSTLDSALVVEPYNLDSESLRNLLAFADRYSLNVTISATSHHYPTRTLAIFLTPREEAKAA